MTIIIIIVTITIMKILKKILIEFDYLDPYINDNNDNHDNNNLKQ